MPSAPRWTPCWHVWRRNMMWRWLSTSGLRSESGCEGVAQCLAQSLFLTVLSLCFLSELAKIYLFWYLMASKFKSFLQDNHIFIYSYCLISKFHWLYFYFLVIKQITVSLLLMVWCVFPQGARNNTELLDTVSFGQGYVPWLNITAPAVHTVVRIVFMPHNILTSFLPAKAWTMELKWNGKDALGGGRGVVALTHCLLTVCLLQEGRFRWTTTWSYLSSCCSAPWSSVSSAALVTFCSRSTVSKPQCCVVVLCLLHLVLQGLISGE